jgi:hypothetical protein
MRNHARGTILMLAVVCTFVLAGPAPVAAQTSGIRAGLTFGPAEADGQSGLGFVTGWHASSNKTSRRAPADVQAELLVGARNFQSPAFFGRGALLLRVRTNPDDDADQPSARRVHFLIGPQVEWRQGTGSVVSRTGARPDVKLVLGGDIEIRNAFIEVRYTADVATETRISPPTVEVTRTGPRLVPSSSRKVLDLRNGAVMVTVGMRLR